MRARVLIVCGLALVCFGGSEAWGYTLKGCVKDERGAPVAGATVELATRTPQAATTDARGCYRFEDVVRGIYRITVRAGGAELARSHVELAGPRTDITADFQLRPPGPAASPGPSMVLVDLNALQAAELGPDPAPPPRRNSILSFTVSPPRVMGGTSATGTITLAEPAPPGGIRMRFNAKLSPVLGEDIPVEIPAGARTAKFQIPTRRMTGPNDVRVALDLVDSGRRIPATLVVESSTRVTIQRTGSGSGLVVSTPAGLRCAPLCSAPFAEGAVVQLTATPFPGSVFSGWSENCTGGKVTVSAIAVCLAQFTKE